MDTFDHVLNWKLKRGSHSFPGPDGGTCINEAALVAAGFPYKPVGFVFLMPRCFSRPICRLAMILNDIADDADRQRLLPYLTRLACADTWWVERQRAAFICLHIGGYPLLSFDKGLEALKGALAIGRQADPLGPEEVLTRMDTARAGRFRPKREATPALDMPFFSKVKGWLTMKETEPAA